MIVPLYRPFTVAEMLVYIVNKPVRVLHECIKAEMEVADPAQRAIQPAKAKRLKSHVHGSTNSWVVRITTSSDVGHTEVNRKRSHKRDPGPE